VTANPLLIKLAERAGWKIELTVILFDSITLQEHDVTIDRRSSRGETQT